MNAFEPRWQATVFYRTDKGTVEIIHDLEEIEDLHDLVEAGPHWDTIEKMEIVRVGRHLMPDVTVEGAQKL